MPRTRSDLAQSPLRLARRQLNLTLADFADVCNVHEQALYLNECGCYTNILPAVEEVLNGLGFDVSDLNTQYKSFQSTKREAFGTQHACSVWTLGDLGIHKLDKSPVCQLRDRLSLSQLGFAKSICIQPALVYKCEKARAASLPEQLTEAFKETGLSKDLVDELDNRQNEFYYHMGGNGY